MPRSALVLGGGGLTGIGWEAGMLHGLAELGVDLTTADVVVGTSAGSVVGAQIGSHSPEEMYAGQLAPPDAELGSRMTRGMVVRLALPVLLPGSPVTKRRRIGSAALRAHPPGGHERVEVIRSRVGAMEWPDRDLRITSVNAETGEFAVFTRDSGVDLVHAVAASCAVPLVWPAVSIDDRPWIDGGMRSTANVDVAKDAEDVVVVIAPLPQSFSKSTRISTQLTRCRARRHVVLTPDRESLAAFGPNVLDPARRADAARAGVRQAADAVAAVREAWEG